MIRSLSDSNLFRRNQNEKINQNSNSDARNTSIGSTVDVNDPLYVHASEGPGLSLVSDQFDGKSFAEWRRSIKIALSAKNKSCFIDGSYERPKNNRFLANLWDRCDNLVISWILNSLTKRIRSSVMYYESASDLWLELEKRFGQSNGAQFYAVRKEICVISQANESITDYFTRLKIMWDELASFTKLPCCLKCGSIQVSHENDEAQKLVEFLMGLNDSYSSTRGQILMLKPAPTTSEAYSMLLQEETQREIGAHNKFLQSVASLYAGNGQKSGQSSGHSSKQSEQTKQPIDKDLLHCTHCNKSKHTVDTCYRIHDFPPGFKFTKNKKVAATVHDVGSHPTGNGNGSGAQIPQIPGLSSAQCIRLLNLLKENSGSGVCGSATVTASTVQNTMAMAGPFSEEATGNW